VTVRSATKKKLMDFGLSEEFAKQLATDRTMSEIESMTPAQIAQVANCSVEKASRIRERIVSKDAHEIDRRLKFRSCTNQLHMSMRSVEADILCLADDRGRIDVNNLLRAHKDVSDDESEPLQEGVFVEMFRDDPVKATRIAIFLISEKVRVPPAVIDGFRVNFVSGYQLTITLGDISEEKLEGVVSGLAESDRLDADIARLDADTASFLIDNTDLARVDDTRICEGDTVIEKFPMNTPRDRDIFDRHPDDLRWPSPFSGKHGLVIDRICYGLLCVEFEGHGRKRAVIHESFCRAMPSNREWSQY
jgi:hypothetical protein